MWYFVAGFVSAALYNLLWPRLRRRLAHWRRERVALPDGTRVRLECARGCGFTDHDGIWTTQWSMRHDSSAPDDYRLTRESDGETTFAKRSALAVVKGDSRGDATET